MFYFNKIFMESSIINNYKKILHFNYLLYYYFSNFPLWKLGGEVEAYC